MFPVAADLLAAGHEIKLGPETLRVCKEAATQAKMWADNDGDVTEIVCPAGISPRYKINMGHMMAEHFRRRHAYPWSQIRRLTAETFNTAGETLAVAKFVYQHKLQDYRGDEYKVIIVARWWHSYRAEFLFRRMMRKTSRRMSPSFRQPEIAVIRVSGSSDWKGILREPFAWGVTLLSIMFRKS